jgi:hypothetical protein
MRPALGTPPVLGLQAQWRSALRARAAYLAGATLLRDADAAEREGSDRVFVTLSSTWLIRPFLTPTHVLPFPRGCAALPSAGISRADYDVSQPPRAAPSGTPSPLQERRFGGQSSSYDPRPWSPSLRTTLGVVLASRSCREALAWRRANRTAVRDAEKGFVDPNPTE